MVPSRVAVSNGFIFLATLAGELVAAPLDSLVSEASAGHRIPAEKATVFNRGDVLPSQFLAGMVENSMGVTVFFGDIPGISLFEVRPAPGEVVPEDTPVTTVIGTKPSVGARSGAVDAGLAAVGSRPSSVGSRPAVTGRYLSALGDLVEFRVEAAVGRNLFTDSKAFIDPAQSVMFTDRPPFFSGFDVDFGIDFAGGAAVLRDPSGRGKVMQNFPGQGIKAVYPRTSGPWAAALVRPGDHSTLGVLLPDGDLGVKEIGGAAGPAVSSLVHLSGGIVAFRMFAPAIVVSIPSGETHEIENLGREKFSDMAVLDATASDGQIFVVTTRGLFSVSLDSAVVAPPATGEGFHQTVTTSRSEAEVGLTEPDKPAIGNESKAE